MSAETNTPITDNNNNNNDTANNNNNTQQQAQAPRQLNMTADGGSTVIGLGPGKLVCNIHDFETLDTTEFNEHCKTTEGHFLTGQKGCITCSNIIELPEEEGGIPFAAGDNLQCPDCFEKQRNLHSDFRQGNKIRIRQAPQQSQQTNNNNQQGQGQ